MKYPGVFQFDSSSNCSAWNIPPWLIPVAELRCDHAGVASLRTAAGVVRRFDDPLAAIRWMETSLPDDPASPQRWVGYVAYEFARFCDAITLSARDELDLPLFRFVRLARPAEAEPIRFPPPPPGRRDPLVRVFSRNQYLVAARQVLDYIAAGDIYQANLSQRFVVGSPDPAAEVYTRLRSATPATYGALLDFGDLAVVSNSPELFFSIAPAPAGGRRILNRPIKGTRPRAPGMREALEQSEKDRAELAMIVDLQRNDLGRVCAIGSVRVIEPRAIEEHPTVYHGVATIGGALRDDATLCDVLRAVFPCGSITGCPKIRAMQVIDELEPVARGPYCGAVGIVAPGGFATFNVAIRTMTLAKGRAHVSVGGGIVADSDPHEEHDETIVKAFAMLRSLGVDARELR